MKLKCQHCGNYSYHRVVGEEIYGDRIAICTDGTEVEYDEHYMFSICGSCHQPCFYYIIDGNQGNETSLYPREVIFSSLVSNDVKLAYEEACKVKRISKIAFVALLRRGLEVICNDKKATGNTLFKKIQDLVKKDVIPKAFLESSDIIRKFGNNALHSTEIAEMTDEDVEVLEQFFLSIVDYVYSHQNNLAGLKGKIE